MNLLKYRFIEKEYPISGLLPNIEISSIFHKFIEDENFEGNQIGIVTKVKTTEGGIFTLGTKAAINLNNTKDILNYIDYIENKTSWMESWYTQANLASILFIYSQINNNDYDRIQTKFLIENNKNFYTIVAKNYDLSLPYNIPLNNNYS